MREYLINAYLDIFNNYLTLEKYAEHNGLSMDQAMLLKTLAKSVYESEHPDA